MPAAGDVLHKLMCTDFKKSMTIVNKIFYFVCNGRLNELDKNIYFLNYNGFNCLYRMYFTTAFNFIKINDVKIYKHICFVLYDIAHFGK